MSDEIAIRVNHISKTFKLPHERVSSIKGALINFARRKKGYEIQHVLNDVSFEIKKGEFFGIVGRNGSGKSTLLKLLAGIYTPTKGSIQIDGKLTPFIELGVGFNPELTGRENVFLNGALLGFNRKEMEAMYDDIVAFAELERFMDQKLKNYSSGMQVRLAFSIAIRAKSDILLIDEVLAVGDAAFQQKCYEFFVEMKRTNRTMILVTHDMSAVSRFCDRALLINDGDAQKIGKSKDIADAYLELNYEETKNTGTDSTDVSQKVSIKRVSVHNGHGKGTSFDTNNDCLIDLEFANPEHRELQFGMQIFNESGTYCFGTNTYISGVAPIAASKGKVRLKVQTDLVPGTYSVTAAIMNKDATKVLVYKPNRASFRIVKSTEIEGVANLPHKWSVENV